LRTLLGRRFRLVDDPREADAVVVNTCGFIERAVRESLDTVMELAELPSHPIVAAVGCLATRYARTLGAAVPEAALVVGLDELPLLPDLLARALSEAGAGGEAPQKEPAVDAPVDGAAGLLWDVEPAVSGISAYLTVSDGCDRRCAYCAIPSIRGPHRSRRPEAILAEARTLVASGVRELVLVGQDVSAFGCDTGEGWDLARLVGALSDETEASAREPVWLRLLYLQPDAVDERLLDALADSASAVPYLDIPIQHVAPAVLRGMGRTGDRDRFADLARRVRERLPHAVLRTTVMCGFPGETPGAFASLERFVAEGHFDYVGAFAYSREDGTRAAQMGGRVRRDVAERRRARIEIAAGAAWEGRAAALVGTEIEVLVEGASDDPDFQWMGRWQGQAPDVDGVVYWTGAASRPHTRVTVAATCGYDLQGVATG
jgi:ribosomal protein S12 methylthiotransferase